MKHKLDGWDWITDLQCLVLLSVLDVLLFTLLRLLEVFLAATEARSANLNEFGQKNSLIQQPGQILRLGQIQSGQKRPKVIQTKLPFLGSDLHLYRLRSFKRS